MEALAQHPCAAARLLALCLGRGRRAQDGLSPGLSLEQETLPKDHLQPGVSSWLQAGVEVLAQHALLREVGWVPWAQPSQAGVPAPSPVPAAPDTT